MSAYYNENEPYAAQWLRNLIAANLIAPGDVDERSIADVSAADLRGYRQCHFFAGIGVWSYALRLAGWPDASEVWTGSCPCQPFSDAGKRAGYADERHLWPHWHRLIGECRPATVFGEQVAAAIGTGWLDDVSLSLEELGYAFGAVDFPAASVGAPHIRQRVYFVAELDDPASARLEKHELALHLQPRVVQRCELGAVADHERGEPGGVADAEHAERRALGLDREDGRDRQDCGRQEAHGESGACGEVRDLGDAEKRGFGTGGSASWESGWPAFPNATNSFWRNAIWLPCSDGKARPTEPGLLPLAHGASARVGRLRAYGNAIVAPQAAEFVRAYMERKP